MAKYQTAMNYRNNIDRFEIHAMGCAHVVRGGGQVEACSVYEGDSPKDAIARVQAVYLDEPTPHIAPCLKKKVK